MKDMLSTFAVAGGGAVPNFARQTWWMKIIPKQSSLKLIFNGLQQLENKSPLPPLPNFTKKSPSETA